MRIHLLLACCFAFMIGSANADAPQAKKCGFFARIFKGCVDRAPAPVAPTPVPSPIPPELHEYLIHGWFVSAPNESGDSQSSCDRNAAEMLDRFTRATGIQGATANCDEPFSVDEKVVLASEWRNSEFADITEAHRVTVDYITLRYKAPYRVELYEASYGDTDEILGGRNLARRPFASYYECETEALRQKVEFEKQTGLVWIGARCVADLTDDPSKRPLAERPRAYALTLYGYSQELKNRPKKALFGVPRGRGFGADITSDPMYIDRLLAAFSATGEEVTYLNRMSPLAEKRAALQGAGRTMPWQDSVIMYYRERPFRFGGIGTIARFEAAEQCEAQIAATTEIYSETRNQDQPAFKAVSVSCDLPVGYRNMSTEDRARFGMGAPKSRELNVTYLSERSTFYTDKPRAEVGNYLSFEKCTDPANKARVISNFSQTSYEGRSVKGMICVPASNYERYSPLDQQFEPLLFKLSY